MFNLYLFKAILHDLYVFMIHKVLKKMSKHGPEVSTFTICYTFIKFHVGTVSLTAKIKICFFVLCLTSCTESG